MSHQTGNRPAPLAGIRVLDFTTVIAGPYCTYQLALLGAEVIKVERPGGDWARAGSPVRNMPNISAQFAAQNAAKRCITLNLQTEAGLALAHQLIASSDILVENFTPGVADRLGIGFEAARQIRSDLVYCAISGYGQEGDFSSRPAYDHVIQAMCGITTLNGTPDTIPQRIGPPMIDYLAGIYGAFAVMSGLRERDRTGQAQFLDVSMLDAALCAMSSTVSQWSNAGITPRANGNTAASGSPASGIFPTRDGLLALAANQEHQVQKLCRVLGRDELLTDARFADKDVRQQHGAEFTRLLTQALLDRTAAEWELLLSQAHVPAARVRTVPDVLAEPHIAQRGVQQAVQDEAGGEVLTPAIGFRWNHQALGPATPPVNVGTHTLDVLAELGLDQAEIAALQQNGAI